MDKKKRDEIDESITDGLSFEEQVDFFQTWNRIKLEAESMGEWWMILEEPPDSICSLEGQIWLDKVKRGINHDSVVFPDTAAKGEKILGVLLEKKDPPKEEIHKTAQELLELFWE